MSAPDVSHRDDVRERLSSVERDRAAEGRYPYDGEWLSKPEIDQRVARRQRQSFLHLMQLLALFVAMACTGLLLLAVLTAVCY